MTWIKICGITRLEDALAAVRAGADALGFIFHTESPRAIQPQTARAIVDQLPQATEKIGVFVNTPPERVSEIADCAGLTAVQLHGDEYRDATRFVVSRKVLVSLPASSVLEDVQTDGASSALLQMPKNLLAVLVDSGNGHERGGTGKTFDWNQAGALISRLKRRHPVVVAGGLNANNVQEAIRTLRPWGVDVSSGVEASPGRKDPDKMRAFVKAVRLADFEHSKN